MVCNVLFKNGRTLLIVLMALLFAGQAVASATAVNVMILNDTSTLNVSMNDSQSPCHDAQGSHSDANIAMSDMTSQSLGHCCDVDCYCSLGHCTPAALSFDEITNRLTVVSPKNHSEFQWIIGKLSSYHYRPPIGRYA